MKHSLQRSAENKPMPCSQTFRNERQVTRTNATERNAAQPDIPARSQAFPKSDAHETNPIALTPRQLAAVRLLSRGLSTDDAAGQLGTTRQTINRWRRLPGFTMEIQRLHEMFAMRDVGNRTNLLAPPLAAGCTHRNRPRAAGLKGAPARQVAREEREKQRRFEATMDRLLAPPNLRG
jgi:hypothetical protein